MSCLFDFSDDDEVSDDDHDKGSNEADESNKSENDLPKMSPKTNNAMELILIDDMSDDEVEEPEDPNQVQQELTKLFEESKNSPRRRAPEPYTSTLPFALKHPITHKRVMLQPESSMCVSVINKHPKSTVCSSSNVENNSSSRIDIIERQPEPTTSSSTNTSSISSSSTSSIEKKINEIEIINSFKPLDDNGPELPSIAMTFSISNAPIDISDMMNTTLSDPEEPEIVATHIINVNDSDDNIQLIESDDDDIICMEENPRSPTDYRPRETPCDYDNDIGAPSTSTAGNTSDDTVILLE